jgi:hypothetical protein
VDTAKASKVGRRGTRAIWKRLDCLKPNIQKMEAGVRRKDVRNRRRSCVGILVLPAQPPGRGAIPSEGI